MVPLVRSNPVRSDVLAADMTLSPFNRPADPACRLPPSSRRAGSVRIDNVVREVAHPLGSVAESTQTRTRHQYRALERVPGPPYMAPMGCVEGVLRLDHPIAFESNVSGAGVFEFEHILAGRRLGHMPGELWPWGAYPDRVRTSVHWEMSR